MKNENESYLFQNGTFFYMIQIASQETNVSPRMLWEVTGCFFRWRIIERKQA